MKRLIKKIRGTSLSINNAKSNSTDRGFFSPFYSFLDRVGNLFINNKGKDDNLITITKTPRRMGVFIIFIFFGLFGVWAMLAPIDGAIISMGQVVVKSSKKILQHLEGGIVDKILVKEGEYVTEGTPLIYLSDVSVKSQLSILSEKLHLLKSAEARLIAESNDYPEIEFPKEIIHNISDEKIKKIVDNQTSLFKSRTLTIDGQINIMNKRIEQTNNEIKGIESQLSSTNQQVKILEEELGSKRELLKTGYISRSQIAPIEREYANFVGKVGEYQAMIARAGQKISETELEIISIKNRFHNDVINELKEVDTSISEVEQKMNAFADILERSVIKSPQSGKVTGMRYYTVGGVIPPGATIMEIIATDEDMIVEARVLPQYIETILTAQGYSSNIITMGEDEGLRTKIRLTAFNSRKLGLLQGVLTYISANTIVDPVTGMQYYLAHVRVPSTEIDKIKSNIKLYPGMPVVAYIITESRTLFSYLFSPITSTFDNAFRER